MMKGEGIMKKHGLLGIGWCMIVRKCRRCRERDAAAAKERLRQLLFVAGWELQSELRAEGLLHPELPGERLQPVSLYGVHIADPAKTVRLFGDYMPTAATVAAPSSAREMPKVGPQSPGSGSRRAS